MKATELMIGDWANLGETYIPIQVNAIYGDYIEWGAEHLESIEDIKPLPLTAEILEKNGFVISNEEPVIDEIGVSIIYGMYKRIDEDQCTNYGNSLYPIKYVHQLQHAIRLCGIDKEIVI